MPHDEDTPNGPNPMMGPEGMAYMQRLFDSYEEMHMEPEWHDDGWGFSHECSGPICPEGRDDPHIGDYRISPTSGHVSEGPAS